MKYPFIAEHCGDYPVTVMCYVLEVSVSGYYAWRKREPSQHSREDAALAAQVELAFENNRRVYGSPRIPGSNCMHKEFRVVKNVSLASCGNWASPLSIPNIARLRRTVRKEYQ